MLSQKIHTWCVNLKKFSAMSIYNLCSKFAKTQRRYYKKNDIIQFHHFTKIATVTRKVSKKNLNYLWHSIVTFAILIMKIMMLWFYVTTIFKKITTLAISQFFLHCDFTKILISILNLKFEFWHNEFLNSLC